MHAGTPNQAPHPGLDQWRCGAPGAGGGGGGGGGWGADIYNGAPLPTKFNFCMLAARIYVHTSHVIYRKLSRSFLRANDKEWCTIELQ